ncbi:MAG: hypothetical protein LBM96_04255 [Methanobrevibacter sp.]|jgi:hypothetical protein|nr:hypothetical protein [Candidatus Methanoflexus mossambicus]
MKITKIEKILVIIILIQVVLAGFMLQHIMNDENKKSMDEPINITTKVLAINQNSSTLDETGNSTGTTTYIIENDKYKDLYIKGNIGNPKNITVGTEYTFTIATKRQIDRYNENAKIIAVYPAN